MQNAPLAALPPHVAVSYTIITSFQFIHFLLNLDFTPKAYLRVQSDIGGWWVVGVDGGRVWWWCGVEGGCPIQR